MTWETLDDVNTSAGIHTLFTYVADAVPIFYPLVLFALFLIACVGSYFASIRLNGRGDFPASFAAGGFFTALVATMMSLVPLITLPTLVLTYGVTLIGALWLVFSR